MLRAVVACAALASWPAPAAAQRSPEPGRPLIVLIHGRAQEFRTTAQLNQEWIGALRDGVDKIGLNGAIRDDDLAFVSYQTVMEPDYPAQNGCRASERTSNHVQKLGGTSGLFNYFFRPGKRAAMLTVRDALGNLLESPTLVLGALDDVNLYFKPNGGLACHVNRRLADTLRSARRAGRPVIIAAHSLGSLVTYRVLTAMQHDPAPPDVRRFVSFGSQLPVRGLIKEMLKDSAPPGRVVPVAASWVNVVGLGDPAAFELRQNTKHFKREDSRLVELHVATEPVDRHSSRAYLKHPYTAQAIGHAWCEAFRPGAAPGACAQVLKRGDVADSLTPERYPRMPLWELSVGGYTADHSRRQRDGWSIMVRAPVFPVGLRYNAATPLVPSGSDDWELQALIGTAYASFAPYSVIGGGRRTFEMEETLVPGPDGTLTRTTQLRHARVLVAGVGLRVEPIVVLSRQRTARNRTLFASGELQYATLGAGTYRRSRHGGFSGQLTMGYNLASFFGGIADRLGRSP